MMPAGMMLFRDPAIKVFIPQKKFFLGHYYQYEDRFKFVTFFFFFSTPSSCASLGVVVA